MFTPTDATLTTINENVNFSFSITYTLPAIPPLTGTTSYTVVITKLEQNPSTVIVSGNNISGYYHDSFDNNITYRTKQDTFVTVNKFDEIDTTTLLEMISYSADTNHYKNYTYRADAMSLDGTTVIDSKVYTIIVSNDWTAGKDSLQNFVEYTIASRN